VDATPTIPRANRRSVDFSTAAPKLIVAALLARATPTPTHARNQGSFARASRLGTSLEIEAPREENKMSQLHVERIIGVLATDEALRHRFATDPTATLKELAERGIELTSFELASLACLDPDKLERFARAIDARLQKIDLRRGAK